MSDASSVNLHTLEQDLQARLHGEPSLTQPMQVRCVFKEGILIVLVQHGTPALPYPRKVFRVIRQFIQETEALQHQVLMYLRVEGSNQPYAFHTLTEESKPPEPQASPVMAPVPTPAPPVAQEEIEEEIDHADSSESGSIAEEFAAFATSPEPTLVAEDEEFEEDEEFDGEEQDFLDNPEEEGEELGFEGFTSVEEGFEDDDADLAETGEGDRRFGKATLAFAACLALAFFGTTYYVLSRPCVVGGCATMDRADELSNKAVATFKGTPTGQEILTAKGQLQEAVDELESIPFWSPRYAEAQGRLKDYYDLSVSLNEVINALYKASDAANMSQNPPFPAETWAQIAEQWESAIANLNKIPPQDFFHPFAQSKIKGYKLNLDSINARLTQEKEAVGILAQAKDDAKIAQVQQGVAQSLDSWEEAYLSWSKALQKLETVAEGTTSYDEAQDLISSYVPQMSDSKERQDQEAFARDVYDQGLRIAQLARDAELVDNWEEATFHWRNAIRYMEEVPDDTYQANLAKPAIARFRQSVENSQVQLQLYTRLKQAETDLGRTCAGDPNICTFTIDARSIKVRLTAAYVKEVQETAVQASATNNSDAKIRILDHIATLEQALEIISKNTQVPVQVYDVNGVLLVDYNP